jgi:hypothetical protein
MGRGAEMIDESPRTRRELTKRDRLIIILVVGVALLAGPIIYHLIAERQADDAIARAMLSARAAAPTLDNSTLFSAYASTVAAGGRPSTIEGLPVLPGAQVVEVDANPTSATITYQVSAWGQTRCLNIERTASDATADAVGCPFGSG